MKKNGFNIDMHAIDKSNFFYYFIKWSLLTTIIGLIVGSLSALFLFSLDWVTSYRESNIWIIAFLPIGGLIIGLLYHYFGNNVIKGNNQLLEEFHEPKQVVPIRMAPLVYIGTLLTHLFGGSAGREGTAVQVGGAIADQFTHFLKLTSEDRKILIVIGISAGFASVFGTPLAGAVFALEVLLLRKTGLKAIFPSFLAAYVADFSCETWQVTHTHYSIDIVPELNANLIIWTIFAGIIFGLTAILFSKSTHFFSGFFKRIISYPPLRPMIGGVFIALSVYMIGSTKFIGLGIPTIQDAFTHNQEKFDFLIKILFTSFTLGAGFKGGEVTPLFFIGAVLGNSLALFIPLPMALLAGMGFIAVFSGATHAPISSTLMGIEIFGWESVVYIGLASLFAYLFSGLTGIYTSQQTSPFKQKLYSFLNLNKARKTK